MKKSQNSLSDVFVTASLIVQNDEKVIVQFIRNIYRNLNKNYDYFEILVVDNSSNDNTLELVRQQQRQIPEIRIISLSYRHNLQTAYLAALENSLGDYVVIFDLESELSHLIKEFIDKSISGFDVVIANPTLDNRYSPIEKTVLKFIDTAFIKIMGVNFYPNAYFSGVFSRSAVNSLVKVRNKKLHLRYSKAFMGLTKHYFDYKHMGKKIPFISSLRLAVDVLISNSQLPLRLTTLLGMSASFLSLMFVVYVFIVTLVKKQIIEGWITTSLVTGGLLFLLFAILTVLSEYVGRILTELKDEPVYYIAKEFNSGNTTVSRKHKKLNVV